MKSPTKNKIIVILGPTASGKSELAVKIALRLGSGQAEIISADSRQVYKDMNIGTGKVPGKWKPIVSKLRICKKMTLRKGKTFIYKNIPHYCIDCVSPKKRYTVIDFKKCAEKAIKNIQKRGKVPIVCGGTGFYISALTGEIEIPEVKPDWQLRKKLEKKSAEELFQMLKKLNPERAKNIDAKNPRRLIRAIEIAKSASTTVVEAQPKTDFGGTEVRLRFFGIKLPDKELKKRIEKRIKKMIRDGLIREAKNLRNSGLSWKRLYELGFEYKYPAMFLQGKINKEEMINRIILENWHYAKRQMTWFKKYQPQTKWIESKNLFSGPTKIRTWINGFGD
ncbi:tRNA (adenosine(37)-N6)-dimethylallyltransferase MiaA, partial [Patescibacteria group bacterium]|nr:tRNA (adenosine(37)-N6)-dimethylallyltransferase MiaA [Patescibacteria group bacterium]